MPQDIPGTSTLSKGPYQIPSPKDNGNEIADVLEEFMERMSNHDHQGADSKKITLNFDKEVQDLTIGVDLTWQSFNEAYRAQVTLPVAASPDNQRRFYFKDGAYYTEFFPTQEMISATAMWIYTNDNTIDVRIVYF